VSFLVAKDGQQLGPFSAEEVNAQLSGGMLDPSDLGWTEGFEDWYPLEQIEGFIVPGEEMVTEEVPVTENPLVTGVSDQPVETAPVEEAAPGLMTAGEATSGGRKKWLLGGAVLLMAAGAFFVFGGSSELDAFCQELAKLHPKTGLPANLEAKLRDIRKVIIKLVDDNGTRALAGPQLDKALALLKATKPPPPKPKPPPAKK